MGIVKVGGVETDVRETKRRESVRAVLLYPLQIVQRGMRAGES